MNDNNNHINKKARFGEEEPENEIGSLPPTEYECHEPLQTQFEIIKQVQTDSEALNKVRKQIEQLCNNGVEVPGSSILAPQKKIKLTFFFYKITENVTPCKTRMGFDV